MKLTIDTCLINTKARLPAMNRLEQWQSEGKVELVGTQRLKSETKRHVGAAAKTARMRNVSEPLVWGISNWGEGYWGSENDGPDYVELAAILFPTTPWDRLNQNQQNDVMHLMGHAHSDSLIFLTDNSNDFIKDGRRETLESKHGIRVMTPREAVDHLSALHGWPAP